MQDPLEQVEKDLAPGGLQVGGRDEAGMQTAREKEEGSQARELGQGHGGGAYGSPGISGRRRC